MFCLFRKCETLPPRLAPEPNPARESAFFNLFISRLTPRKTRCHKPNNILPNRLSKSAHLYAIHGSFQTALHFGQSANSATLWLDGMTWFADATERRVLRCA